MPKLYTTPEMVFGPEAAYEKAEEIMLNRASQKELKRGNRELADKMCLAQPRLSPNHFVYVEVEGERIVLGHVGKGIRLLTALLNRNNS